MSRSLNQMPLLLLRTAALAVQHPPEDNQTYRRDAAEPYVQRGQPKPDEYPCDEGREDHCDGPLDPRGPLKNLATRGPPWTSGASSTTCFAHTRSWTGRFDSGTFLSYHRG